MRPCHCDRCAKGGPWEVGHCRLCWLYHNQPAYRSLWEAGPAETAVPEERSLPCRHRGAVLGEQVCPSCRGLVRLKVLACTVHGRCTVARALPDCPCCAHCGDYRPAAEPADGPAASP